MTGEYCYSSNVLLVTVHICCVNSSASVIVVDLGGLEVTSSSKEFVVRIHCI